MVYRRLRQLGHRAFRISHPGPGEPYRLRDHEPCPAENITGGDHPVGIRSFRRPVHGSAPEAEFSLGRVVPGGSGLLYIQGLSGGPFVSNPDIK